jgi:hypothetical protein
MTRLVPGFHRMPAAQYHADPCPQPSLSNSLAKKILSESAKKAWYCHPRLNPSFREEQDDKFDLGSTAHAALLEGAAGVEVIDPADYPSKTGSIPDGWTNVAIRAAREAARALGKTPILKRHYDDVQSMVDVALEFIAESEIAEFWFAAESEVTGVCVEGSVWLRCRFDKLASKEGFIGDYKTTEGSVAPGPFSMQITRMGYHIQDAFYRRVARGLGMEAPRFVFLAQSCEPPFECSLHGCDPAMQEIADAEVERAIDVWRACMSSKRWPSYGGRIHWVGPTNFMMNDHEARLAEAA